MTTAKRIGQNREYTTGLMGRPADKGKHEMLALVDFLHQRRASFFGWSSLKNRAFGFGLRFACGVARSLAQTRVGPPHHRVFPFGFPSEARRRVCKLNQESTHATTDTVRKAQRAGCQVHDSRWPVSTPQTHTRLLSAPLLKVKNC